MTTLAEKIAFKATSDFAAFLRLVGHTISVDDDAAVEGYMPVIGIDYEKAFGGFSLHPDDSENGPNLDRYHWEFMHYNSGTLISSQLDENTPMDKIYEFFKDCVEKSKTL